MFIRSPFIQKGERIYKVFCHTMQYTPFTSALRVDTAMYTHVRNKVARIKRAKLIFLMISVASLSIPINLVADVQASKDGDNVPIS